jgi:hypothetical protein
MPQDRGVPEQAGASAASPPLDANTESFFSSFAEPQCGHAVHFQSVVRTSTSLSRLHSPQ